MANEWRPIKWREIKLHSLNKLADRKYFNPAFDDDYFEAGADTILQALYEETKAQPIWLDKSDDGHILICVKQ